MSEQITHAISGSLFDELAHGTALDDGSAPDATWGYGATRDVDIEVEQMVRSATSVKRGFGRSHTMTGSRAAWVAIKAYANDRAYMEQALVGEFDGALGRRLSSQADRIDEALA